MKKTILTFLFLFVGFCVFAQGGVILETSGTVELRSPGAVSFIAAKPGDYLTQDTVISTSFKSFAVIEVGFSSITVRPLTRLTLTEIQAASETETLNVNLQSGRVRIDVKPPAGSKTIVSINSPSSVASVRGTSFEFDTRGVYVDEGIVSFSGNRGQEVTVNAGASSRIEGDSRAANPMDIKAGNIFPASLAGSNIAGGINSGPVRMGVPFIIGLTFE